MNMVYEADELELKNVMLDRSYAVECQPYEYYFFKVPEELYGNLAAVVLDITVMSGKAVLVLNEYLPNQPFELSGSGTVRFDISECEKGENMLAYKGQIRVRHVEFVKCQEDGEIEAGEVDCKGTAGEAETGADPVRAAAEFLVRSRIMAPQRSQFLDSCYAIYDYTNACHRMPCWLWSDAPVVSALLMLAGSGRYEGRAEEYIETAKGIGETFLRTQIQDPNDEMYGALVSRYRYYGRTSRSFHRLLGMNDTSYSVKWALLPLYEFTGDSRYKAAAGAALDWVERNLHAMDFVPSHYYYEDKMWENRAFVDTGFCAEGFEQYQKVVGDRDYGESVNFLMWRFLKQFRLNNGFYGQNYRPETGVDDRLFTRGHAWVLEGLLARWRMNGDKQYRQEAKQLCDKLASLQRPDGSFSYLLGYDEPDEQIMYGSGTCEKTTAILACLFYEYDRLCPDDSIRTAAALALNWCRNNMVWAVGEGYGGIAAKSLSSGITGLPFLRVATGYANAYYIMAELMAGEELRQNGSSVTSIS